MSLSTSTAVVVSIEMSALVFMLTILYAVLFENPDKQAKTGYFVAMVAAECVALIIDSASYLLDGNAAITSLLYVLNFASATIGCVVSSLYAYYIAAAFSDYVDVPRSFTRSIVMLNIAGVLYTLIFTCNGMIFSIENGCYTEGPLISTVGISSVISLVLFVIFALKNRKHIGWHDAIAILIFIAFPFVGAIADVLIPIECSFALPLVCVAIVLNYIMLQSRRLADSQERERLVEELSRRDPLTGLNNRLAYNKFLNTLFITEKPCSVFFSDLNNLKYTNDHFGHAAGDKIICDYAELLKKHFPDNSIYRVSGDEFVVILCGQTEEEFSACEEKLRADIRLHAGIASLGSNYASGRLSEEIIAVAETRMYADKEAYHLRTGHSR